MEAESCPGEEQAALVQRLRSQESVSPASSAGPRPQRLDAVGHPALAWASPTTTVTESHSLSCRHVPPAVRPAFSCVCSSGAVSGGHTAPALGSCRLRRSCPQPGKWPQLPREGPLPLQTPLLPGAVTGQEMSPHCRIYSPGWDPDYSSPAPLGERSQEMLSASVKSDFKLGWPPRHWAPPGTAAPGPAQKSSGDSFSSWK